MNVIEYPPGLPEAPYCVVTPYLVPPGPKKVNVGDGFILDSAVRLLGARPRAAFSSRAPLDDAAIEAINASRCLVAVGANTLKDDFELAPRFDLATLARIRVPVILMGVGHYGVPAMTRGLTANSQALFRAFLERFPRMSVRCDASRRYVLQALPDKGDNVVMTSCPVAHAVDGIDRGFARKAQYDLLVVTITDRLEIQAQLPMMGIGARAFPAARRILALHQDYGNAGVWQAAQQQGFEVLRGDNHQDFLRLYRDCDVHFGNRVHAHLKCVSLGTVSFCTPFDLRQAYFAESLDFPLIQRFPEPLLETYDFARTRARRDAARATMDTFVRELSAVIGLVYDMAINSPVLEIIAKVAQQLPAPRRMLCLGYPDMLVTEAQIATVCGPEAIAKLAFRDDSESILRWHSLAGQMSRVAETRSLFAALGIECDFVDIVASRGFELMVDLNEPAPADLQGRYDIVYDGGTMEHCFNVGQVMRNIFAFARVGGFIVHVNPINYYNHGFFNFNPTFYHDWYGQSGNAIVTPFYAMHGPVIASRLTPLDATRSYAAPERSVMLVAAKKNRAEMPAWPMQTKYLRNSELKG